MNELSLASELLTTQEAMRIASMAVGLVFAFAVVSKFLDLPGFIAGVRGYNVIPLRIAPLAAGLLVVGESLIAATHLSGAALQFAVPGTIAFLLAFIITMAKLLKSGEKRPCLCFGASRDEFVDIYSLVRIVLLMSAEVALFIHLLVNDGSNFIGTANMNVNIASIVIAASVVMLVGWWLALPKFYRAWRVVTS